MDTLSTDRPRRWRPATEAEAIASAESRAAGDGGWIALVGGHVTALTDPAVLTGAGRYTPDQVEIAYVADTARAGRPAGSILAGALLGEGRVDHADVPDIEDVTDYAHSS
ncbi:hypothetical protein [Candidatus Frankia nodulisporulans]|uniref:hypothetical protein n=1 Tax=Candidatus Frankia nodulisporulans TaxID=2060052 RepID=UPI0013D63CF6|nr:hypothetical protein [Candidatus Frankia nodulisporulans]